MKTVSGALVAAAIGFFGFSAQAAQVSLTDITGVWSAATLDNNNSPSGVGTSSIVWGVPDTANGKSGYTFAAADPASNLVADTPFTFGLFTHKNFPIYPPSLVSAQLSLSFDLTVDGVAQSLGATYLFNHTETPNLGGGNCCNDIVSFLTSAVAFDSVVIGGVEYTFKLDGFVTDSGTPVSFFSTEEGKLNSAYLVGRFTAVDPTIDPPPSPVPLPLPIALLGFGVTGLAAVGKLRRKG